MYIHHSMLALLMLMPPSSSPYPNPQSRSPEFAEPAERIALFSVLRDRQKSAFDKIVTHVQQVGGQ